MSRPKWADVLVEAWLGDRSCGCGGPAEYGFAPAGSVWTWSRVRAGHAGEGTAAVLEEVFTASCRGCRPTPGRRPGGTGGRTVKQEVAARIAEAAVGTVCARPSCGEPGTVFVSPAGFPSQGQLCAGDQRHRLADTLAVATWFCTPRHRAQATGRSGAYASHVARGVDAAQAAGVPTGTGELSGGGGGFVFEGSVYRFTGLWSAARVASVNTGCGSFSEAVRTLTGRPRGGADIRKLRAATAYYTALDPTFPQPVWVPGPGQAQASD